QAGVALARGVLILTNDDLLNITTALMVRSLNADVRIVLRMFNQNLLARLGQAVRNVFALSTSLLTAPIVAMSARTAQGWVACPPEGSPDLRFRGAEVPFGAGLAARGRSINALLAPREAVAVAYLPAPPPKPLAEVSDTKLETSASGLGGA